MYKMLIVDDETAVRDRLASFDWASLGIDEVAVAEHGLLALKWIQDHPVDILITDIHMPIMDGIELVKQVNAQYEWIRVVVLTGYDDFEYIRTCMRNGVFDYILKPINESEMRETMERLLQNLAVVKQNKIKYAALERKSKLITTSLRRKFLKNFFRLKMTKEEINENCVYSEMNLDNPPYCVMIFRLDLQASASAHYGEEERNLIVFALDNILQEYTETREIGYAWVDPESADSYLLISGDEVDEEHLTALAEETKEVIYKIAQLLDTTVSCGIGYIVRRSDEVTASAASADAILKLRNTADAVLYQKAPEQERCQRACAKEKSSDEENDSLVGKMPMAARGEPIEGTANLKLITRAALDYVDKNFMNSITLDDIAACVYLSPTYISYLFKAEVKMNFINYLTMKRMEKAKELLRDPRLKIYEISSAVGYENSRYFSSIFKKYTGHTPFEYRSSIGV